MTEVGFQSVVAGTQPGARHKKARLRQIPVMMTEADRQVLDAVADEVGKFRSALIREAVRKAWLRQKP